MGCFKPGTVYTRVSSESFPAARRQTASEIHKCPIGGNNNSLSSIRSRMEGCESAQKSKSQWNVTYCLGTELQLENWAPRVWCALDVIEPCGDGSKVMIDSCAQGWGLVIPEERSQLLTWATLRFKTQDDARVLVPLVASARDIMTTSNRVVQCNPKTLACWDDLKFKVSNRQSSLLGRTGKAILYQYYERPRRS